MSTRSRAFMLALPGVLAVLALAACTSEAGTKVAVTGTDDACTAARTDLAAGKVSFEFTNRAGEVSELYVLRDDNSVVGEVENVTTGTRRTLTVSLTAGDYWLVCKPGQKGDGIRTALEVTGGGGSSSAPVADRTVAVTATSYAFGLPAGITVKAGETIRFELTNAANDLEHEMEVFAPDGTALGEVGPTAPGGSGAVTITFDRAGTYRLVCGIEGHEEAGMVADLPVATS
jgi:uncharacterized cupredoxin-like copper-binding protein